MLKSDTFPFFSDLKSLFKAKGKVKTSSPIEAEKAVESVEELSDEFNTVCSPILFTFEDDGEEESVTEHLSRQKCNGYISKQ